MGKSYPGDKATKISTLTSLLVELLLHARLGHVRCQVDLLREGLNLDGEFALHLLEDLLVVDLASRVIGGGDKAAGENA
jgi:hypothetical protein